MNHSPFKRWLWGVLGLALVFLALAISLRGWRSGTLQKSSERTTPAAGVNSTLADQGVVRDFDLVSQTGERVRLADLEGQVWIGDFIFTSCAASCPMMSAQLEKLAESVGPLPGVRFVSFSVDPERDTPEKLAAYAEGYGADPERWLFLTGDKQEMRTLVQEGFHLSAQDATPEEIAAGSEPVLHSTRFVLVDAKGQIRGYYNGLDDDAMALLGKHVRELVADASVVVREH